MPMPARILLAIGLIVLDAVFVFIPLTAFFLAYILVRNPPWFRNWLDRLDQNRG